MSQTGTINALIADNQPLIMAGLESYLGDKQDIKIVGIVKKSNDLVEVVEKVRPALLIADYNIPGFISIDDIRNAMASLPKMNVLLLSSDNDKSSILDAIHLGVKGYVTKECSLDEVGMAIRSTGKGEKFFCHKVLEIIMEKHLKVEPGVNVSLLTARETEILQLIAQGNSTQAIADKLFLSPHTVQTHRKSIIKKLNIKSPTEFVIYAMDFGLLKIR